MKPRPLSPAQVNALRWFALPAGFRAWQAVNATPPIDAPKSATVAALIRLGRLERVPHPRHPKATVVQLTPSGS